MGDSNTEALLSQKTEETESMKRITILSYGVGHMLNDFTAACWFTYLLLFLTDIGLSPRDAAVVMLCGQVADGLVTIIAGEMIDRFGRFKIWHLGGSLFVAVSFSSVFGGCLLCKVVQTNSYSVQTIGYSIFAVIFNIGWAATQVSHMSMVNCMTRDPTSRVALASCRNAFTMVANLGLYGVALVVFTIFDAKSSSDVVIEYRWIAYIAILIGCAFLTIFYVGTKEPQLNQQVSCSNKAKITCLHWFKKVLYFQVALVYMLTRLITNVSQSLLAFYVTKDLRMNHFSKALVPAIIYICSFIVSIILQELKWNEFRLKFLFTTGAIIWIFSGAALFVLPSNMNTFMYPLSTIIGIANALITVTTVGMESILVGEDLDGCGFVYGSLSFLDKISCGIALFILESYEDSNGYNEKRGYESPSRYGTGLIPCCLALLATLVTSMMKLNRTKYSMLNDALLV